ncbi:MAG: arylsulfatase [Chloroflexota bacterium]|nr:arylsulfatase [Chloroflexota bacterium]
MTTQKKPNVIFLLVDNIGWGDLGCYGGMAPTPRLDQLADEGIRFQNYNVEAQCTPTRSAIMTGRLPKRSGTTFVPLPGQGDYGLSPWEYTMAELLSDAGYATALFGKWHLGDVEGRLPTNQGFDEWYGIKNTTDEAGYTSYPMFHETGYPIPQIWEGVKGSPSQPVEEYNLESRALIEEKITQRTIDFIQRHADNDQPFYAYIGFTHVHPPYRHHPDFKGKSGGGLYSDILAEVDYRAGQILDALDDAGIADNSIVIWSSDNASGEAAGIAGSNGPWRGVFASGFEGGMRVPAIVRWPGQVPAGVVTNEMLATYDWMPTLAAMISEADRVPTDRPIDGLDSSALLLGDSEKGGRDSLIFYGSDGEVMSGKWKNIKIVFRYAETFDGPIIKPQFPLAFDLIDDPAEQINLTSKRMDMMWMYGPVIQRVITLEKSFAQYPNIEAGQDFDGYDSL